MYYTHEISFKYVHLKLVQKEIAKIELMNYEILSILLKINSFFTQVFSSYALFLPVVVSSLKRVYWSSICSWALISALFVSSLIRVYWSSIYSWALISALFVSSLIRVYWSSICSWALISALFGSTAPKLYPMSRSSMDCHRLVNNYIAEHTGWPVKHGRLFWYLVKSGFPMYACTVAYTGQVTFYKIPEKYGHV